MEPKVKEIQRFKVTKDPNDPLDNYKNIEIIDDDNDKAKQEDDFTPDNNTSSGIIKNDNENNITSSRSNNSIQNSIQRVKFLSDYSIARMEEQAEPFLEKKKKSEGSKASLKSNDFNNSWIDEKGLIIKNNDKKNHSEKSNDDDSIKKSSKAFKVHYYKDTKSLEFSINMGGKNIAKENGCFSQLKYLSFYQALLAEMLGTYILVLYVCGIGLPIGNQESNDSNASLTGSLGGGFLVASLVWGLANVSGANLNPAVSIALLVTGDSNIIRVLLYIPFQLMGSVLAIATLRDLTCVDYFERPVSLLQNPATSLKNSTNLRQVRAANETIKSVYSRSMLESKTSVGPMPIGLTLLNKNLTPVQGFGIEAIITFILVFTVFACIDKNRKDLGGSFPLTIGIAIVVGALFGGKFTGGSMNPARSFGPAFLMGNWENHWIYWFGPICGAIIGALLYKTLVFKTRSTRIN